MLQIQSGISDMYSTLRCSLYSLSTIVNKSYVPNIVITLIYYHKIATILGFMNNVCNSILNAYRNE